jgi:hypothetical protein
MSIESLEKKFKELKAKEEECRKNAEYHYRKTKDSGIGERGFKKHKAKEEYWRMKWSNVGLESQRVMGDIAALKLEGQKKEYGIRVTAFYRETIEYLITLKEALEKKDMTFAGQVVDDLEQIYLRGSSLDKEDLQPIKGYLPLQSIRIRLGRIVEEQGEEVKINAITGTSVGAQKRSNIAAWLGQLTGQIDTLIKDLEKRINGPTK